jgi:Flp pilus assembly protein TadG
MLARRSGQGRRRGVAIVETAMVLSVALLLLFSVYEYGRYVMLQQMMENASREGARFAAAHTADMTTADVQNQVNSYMFGLTGQLQNYQVSVSGVALRTGPVYAQGTTFSDWTQASPTDGIVVTVSGDYTPDLPTLQFLPTALIPGLEILPSTVHLQSTSIMYSEGN